MNAVAVPKAPRMQTPLGIPQFPLVPARLPNMAVRPYKPHVSERVLNRFQLAGRVWRLSYGAQEALMPDTVGLRYLHRLLHQPGAPITATQLVTGVTPSAEDAPEAPGRDDQLQIGMGHDDSAQEIVSKPALQRIRQELAEIKEELEDLRVGGDPSVVEEREEQVARIEQYLRRCTYHGRSTLFVTRSNRDRRSVSMAIRRAVQAISEIHATLALHLGNSIKTGASCCYRPERPMSWVL